MEAFIVINYKKTHGPFLWKKILKTSPFFKREMETEAPKFSQSAAVNRCRGVKEEKIKAQQALAKLADEEVTIHSANLEHSHHQLRTQLVDQASVIVRQQNEAIDVKISWERKEQLTRLIDKLTAIKAVIRLQHEAQEREAAFKANVREKRAAFQARVAKLEQRHTAERNELSLSQTRVAETVAQIRAIESKTIKDRNQARRMKRENEILSQQASMRQQKEMEYLRTMQLCKARQAGEINDLEISNMEELEDILVNQRAEEFNLMARHALVESDMMKALERQKGSLEASQLIERQKAIKASLQRAQKKKNAQMLKAQAVASRNREKALVADFPIMQGIHSDSEAQDHRNSEVDGTSELDQSENTSTRGDSQVSLFKEVNAEKTEKTEAEINGSLNNAISVSKKNGTDDDRMVNAIIESGNERLKNLTLHHKKVLQELRQIHKSTVNHKNKEHYQRMIDLLKDHEEEIEQVKADQAEAMQELMQTHQQSEEMRADTAISQNLLGMMLPAHIIEKLENGIVPEPENFSCVCLFFTDIFEFKKLVASVDPVNILKLLNVMYTEFDTILSRYSQLYKVESVADTYMVAAGLASHDKTDSEIAECTKQAFRCSMEMQRAVQKMNFSRFVGAQEVKLRIGIHAGVINAGLIGIKMSRYCLFGDTVNTASRMCTTGFASRIQVSSNAIQALGADEDFEFEERGEIEVKGKGKMSTYWLLF
ncbi:hypothetical protein HDU81_007031 [Chytriomyces hyalinus]|nr:hypothetical protein HDU81_007031 [Chytriomyces hyalinus]